MHVLPPHAPNRPFRPGRVCDSIGMPEVPAPDIDAFRRDGVAVVRQLLAPAWIDTLRAGVESNRTHPSEWSHRYTHPDDSIGFWSD